MKVKSLSRVRLLNRVSEKSTHHQHSRLTSVSRTDSENEVAQSCPTLCDPWTVAHQAPPSMGFSRQECWSGLPFPSPGDLPNPGIEPRSPALEADALTFEPPGKPFLGHSKPKSQICSIWVSQVALEVKNPPASEGDADSIPRSGRSPEGGHGNPLQYSCLENPMDSGAWQATVHGVAKSRA